MAKLYFRYGTVNSAKTLNLLAVAHNYQQQEKLVIIAKPKIDDRFGATKIKSRTGLEKEADILIEYGTPLNIPYADCILIDEAQFLHPSVVDRLHDLAKTRDIPVICYGLRTDFRRTLFEGSMRLLELADSIEEIKTTCTYCNRKAVFNLKLSDGVPTLLGPSIELGAEEKYLPVCANCYTKRLG